MNPALWLLLACVAAVLLFRRARRAAEANNRDRLAAGLGSTVDLIAVVIGSGGTVHEAVATVARLGPPPVQPAFRAVLARSDAGMLLGDALIGASDRLGPSYHSVLGALTATERDGAPVSSLLQRLADDAALARRQQLDRLTKRLPVTLLLPLVSCLLPAAIVGAVIPLAIVSLRHLEL